MEWTTATGDWAGRWVFLRALAAVYLVAFLVAVNQVRPLLGERGLLPVARFVEAVPFRRSPSLFHLRSSDRALAGASWVGVVVSVALLVGVADGAPAPVGMALWLVPWLLYLSLVNVGQRWYAFGWETLLCEAGFLAVFLGPADLAPPIVVLVLLRWLLFRVELGAGLIKLRGDPCWRDLTCLQYHHETQPLPGPLSWWFHHLPRRLHKVEVAANHGAQLVLPFLLFAPQPVAAVAALLMAVTQGWLVLSGNFSWLNVLTVALCLSVMGPLLDPLLPLDPPDPLPPAPLWHQVVVWTLLAVVGLLSVRPARNLVARRQRMNTSYDPLRLVNSYGAFGSITRVRHEVVVEGTTDDDLAPAAWREYAFKGKPGDPARRPRQVAPYHLRLDWLMWFAALSPGRREPWFRPFVEALLRGDRDVLGLLAEDPFRGRRPTWVRARVYEYRFTTPAERGETGDWWVRTLVDDYLPPVRLHATASRSDPAP